MDAINHFPAARFSMLGRSRRGAGRWGFPAFTKVSTVVVACLLLVSACSTAAAQELTQPPGSASATVSADAALTVASLQARRKAVEEDGSLDDALRADVVEVLDTSIASLQQQQTWLDKTASLQESTENVSSRLAETRAELEAPTPEVAEPSESADLATVQQQLQQAEEQLRQAEADKQKFEQEDIHRTKRRTESPAELTTAKIALETLKAEEVDDPADDGLHPLLRAANQMLLAARRQMLTARIDFLERELPIYDATSALLAAKRSLAARRVAVARRTVTTWQEHVNEQRMSEAESNLKQATELVSRASPPARPIAEEVRELANNLVAVRTSLTRDIATASRKITQLEKQTERLSTEFDKITARTEVAGLTNSVGVLLQKLNSSLPNQRNLSTDIADRQALISDVHIDRIEYQNQRSEVSDVEDLAERYASREVNGTSENERRELRDEFRKLLQMKGRLLDGVISDLSSYLDRLATLDANQRTLLDQTVKQADYIAEHVLWVRSTTPVNTAFARQLPVALTRLKNELAESGQLLLNDAFGRPQLWLLAVLAGISLLVGRQKFVTRIRDCGHAAQRKYTTTMRPSFAAIWLTAMVAFVWPGILWFIGWRLASGSRTAFDAALGTAFQSSAALTFVLDSLRHVCRPHGLGIAHFGWPPRSVNTVRMSIRLLIFIGVPLTALFVLMDRSGVELYRSSVGRLALMASLITLAFAQHGIFRPHSPVIDEASATTLQGWVSKTRIAWYALGVGLPLVLVVMAAAGYLYTARQLAIKLVQSGGLLVAVVLLAALLKRWQLVTYRGLAMKQARERRAALLQEAENAAGEDEDVELPALEEEVETLSDSNVRLGKLLSVVFTSAVIVGLIVIWSDVMPAIGILSRFELWDSSIPQEVVDGVETYPVITMREICLAIALLALTLFSASNIPGLLEFSILQRLPLDSGTRYATSTVVRYAITVIGVAFSFRLIGLGWSNIQWLVAAMTVGLGFGLQEIFANFVSGLILLFERPIRIGDTVTVGDVTGTVTRIRIRATTIVDWDRKELVVPNREFVTGQLINWTLSDSVLRVVASVGIAYGSDTRLATELLYKVADDNPNVLDEPAPRVIFRSFGDSTLDFDLRCFVSSPQMYRNIPHDLNLAIDDLFREHNIEIAFPQRDLHVRSVPERLVPESRSGDSQSS